MNQVPPTTTEEELKTLEPKKEEVLTFDELSDLVERLNVETLGVLAGTGEKCSIVLDRDCPPNTMGYTIPDGDRITIYLNPTELAKSPKVVVEATCLHEIGHNAKPAVDLLKAQIKALERPEIIPEAYRESPEHAKLFLEGLQAILGNTTLDVFNESHIGRAPFTPIANTINEMRRVMIRRNNEQHTKMLAEAKEKGLSLQPIPLPDQLASIIAYRGRYLDEFNLDEYDSVVVEEFRKLQESGAFDELQDVDAFEMFFATPRDRQNSIRRKERAYNEQFIPAYVALVEEELRRRKEQKQEEKNSQGDGEGEGGEGEENEGSGKAGRKPGAQTQTGGSTSTPLTPEEEQELIEKLLEELKKSGEKYGPAAPSKEEEKNINKSISSTVETITKSGKGGDEGKGKETTELPQDSLPKDPQNRPDYERTVRGLRRQVDGTNEGKDAEAFGVTKEAIQRWREIQKKYEKEITSTASALSAVFLDERRRRLTGPQRSGPIIEGLEAEHISALMSGDPDPVTRQDWEKQTDFLETELEFIVDTSGSMEGEKLERSVDMLVIVTEAFKQVKEAVEAENLLGPSLEPFKIGVTSFTTEALRITKLDDPLSDRKEAKIVDALSSAGGGTDEVDALSGVYKEMALRRENVIKIVIVLSDGQGNPAGVAPIMNKIANENEVVFLAIGLGHDSASAQAIVDTYLEPLLGRTGVGIAKQKNVFGIAASNPQQVLPQVLGFLKEQVEKRRRI